MKSVVPNILSLFAFAAVPSLARNITVINKCSYTIWPATYTDPNSGTAVPDVETGWEAISQSSRSFSAPEHWGGGRIWARSGCSFDVNGSGTCATGGCAGGLKCTGPGKGPVTLTEWVLGSQVNKDWYDVSVVEGFNIPVAITNNAGCYISECPVNLIASCPDELKGPIVDGVVLGCQSACGANLDGTPSNSKNCCTGTYGLPQTCVPSGIQYYSYFKNRCPRAIAYPWDETPGSITGCWVDRKADYTITFCP